MRVLLFQDGGPVEGRLTSPIECLDELAHSWSPLLAGEEDESWNWSQIVAECPTDQGFRQFEVRVGTRVQGVMVLKMRHPMRASANQNQQSCYLEYMATAPWNRPSVVARNPTGLFPKVGGVGTLLLAHAIRLSSATGLGGRLAWHSKPGAVEFYGHQLENALDLGADRTEGGLPYFELGEGEGFKLVQGTASRFPDDES